jgi:hypothetical protein
VKRGDKMKIRSGFVSNSSTTSFCIVGMCGDDIKNKLGFSDEDHYLGEDDRIEGFSVYGNDYQSYIGLDIEEMKNSETLDDFKNRVAIKLSKAFVKNIEKNDISIIIDAWHD